jgi:hypothetical protein
MIELPLKEGERMKKHRSIEPFILFGDFTCLHHHVSRVLVSLNRGYTKPNPRPRGHTRDCAISLYFSILMYGCPLDGNRLA